MYIEPKKLYQQKQKENLVRPDKIVEIAHSSCFVMSPITEIQVSRLFSSLNVQKLSLDVPNKLIKAAAELLSTPLTRVYSHPTTTGIGRLFVLSTFNLTSFHIFLFLALNMKLLNTDVK